MGTIEINAPTVAIGIFVVTHLGTVIWFMSWAKTTLGIFRADITRLEVAISKISDSNYTKSDAEKDFAIRDREHKNEHSAIWRRIDELKSKFNTPQ